MTIQAETAKTSAIQSARQKLNATQDQNAKNKLYADNPQALKDANARAYATFQDEVRAAEDAYDQKTIAMGGTPGAGRARRSLRASRQDRHRALRWPTRMQTEL